MPDTPLAQRLLALFTSPECAEAIAGDLMEARGTPGGDRGAVWFWRQVLTTAVAFFGQALTSAPLATVGVVAAGCVLFGALAFTGFAPVAMFPALLGTPASWVVLSVSWWSAAFFTGFTLVSLSPGRGVPVSVLLAVAGEGLLMLLRLVGIDGDVLLVPGVVFYSITMLIAVPLLLGSAAARRRIISAAATAVLPR